MVEVNDTPAEVEAMARDLFVAGYTTAADMLRRLLARAQTAEAEREALREKALGSPADPIQASEPGVGETLEEIVRGEHQGP